MNACDIIEDAGFRFYEAGSGDGAKSLLEDNARDMTLLFTGVEMPGATNGFALAHHVAQHWPDIEIVIASGRVAPGPGDMPEKATFISKPFSAEVVHDNLHEALPTARSLDLSRRRYRICEIGWLDFSRWSSWLQ